MTNRRVLSLGHAAPSPRIDHAGGQYVRTLLELIATRAEVMVLAPSTDGNEAVLDDVAPLDVRICGTRPGSGLRSRVGAFVDLVALRATPILPSPTFRASLRRSHPVLSALAAADVVDVQWTDYAALLPWLRRQARPDARVVCTMHDVLSEKWERRSATDPSAVMRARARLNARVARRLERLAILHADKIVVFSEKDREHVSRRHGTAVDVVVLDPPLDDGRPVDRTSVDPRSVLFVGAMARPENHDSAMWFLAEIWPAILDEVPDAHLTIAGSRPQPALVDLAGRTPGVTLTGFVEDLAPLRDAAAVFVAPVVAGAGVKFKVIDAMLASVPVVATRRAQEGIGVDDDFVAVTDDPVEFARATVGALLSPHEAELRAARTAEAARARYGRDSFARTVTDVYGIDVTGATC